MTTPSDGTPANASNGGTAGAPAPSSAGAPGSNTGGQPGGSAAAAPAPQPNTTTPDERYGTPATGYAPLKDADFGDDLTKALHGLGKDLNLSEKGMEKVYSVARAHAQSIQGAFETSHKANLADWQSKTAQDSEVGGEKLAENRAIAAKGMDLVASSELKAIMKETGLENHPEFFRAFYRIGKLVAEDRIIRGAPRSGTPGVFAYEKSDHK